MKKILIICLVLLVCTLLFVACYEDETQTTTTTENITDIEVHTHAFGAWITTNEATCTETGEKVRTCACGEKETKTIAATGTHNYIGEVTTAATCTADGVNTFTCSMCNDSYTEVLPGGHKWVDATCTAPKNCTECGETEGDSPGHDYSFAITKEPTCTTVGEITYTCSRCNDSYIDIATRDHYFTDGVCVHCNRFDDYTGCAVVAVKLYFQDYLKNPNSLQLHSIEYYVGKEDKNYFRLEITYSAMNGFGGYNRGSATLYIRMNGDGTFVYNPYSFSDAATDSYSSSAIKYSDLGKFTDYYFS